jgi:serine/threonine protein kinase
MSEAAAIIAYCHSCGGAMDVTAVAPFSNVECPKCGKHTRVKREFGPYTLMRRHAIGGMSMVFGAHDNTLDREVALKILSEDFSADSRRIAAFEEEARITASFSHPNVVRVLTTGRAFGRFYIAMEFVPGGHFEQQIRERGRIPEIEMLPIAIEVAQGLKAAHAAGLIHRDVKPGNVLLDADGHAKLVDFGLALVTQGGKARATEMWATPYYVPPETVEGQSEDFRSDIYAFGATVYHALAGKPPCNEESMATDVLREAKKKVVPLSVAAPHVSAETCRIIERAMAHAPKDRYHSYDELLANLGSALSRLKSGGGESSGSAAKRRSRQKRREFLTLATVVVAILIAGTTAVLLLNGPADGTLVQPPQPPNGNPNGGNSDAGGNPSPITPEMAAEVGRMYREARTALESGNYAEASRGFLNLYQNPLVQEPTRTWAGVEVVLVAFLDGRPTEARKLAHDTAVHARAMATQSEGIDPGLITLLEKTGGMEPLAVPDAAATSAETGEIDSALVIAAMLAGLKNWEQGLPGHAIPCFRFVTAAKAPQDDSRIGIYQKLAADYVSDHEWITGPLFEDPPADKAAIERVIDELDKALTGLKTRGRAKFNVRAWQLDLKRRATLLGQPSDPPDDAGEPPAGGPSDTPEALEILVRIDMLSKQFRFAEALAYLKSVPGGLPAGSMESMVSLLESSAVFLADLEQDLAREPARLDLEMTSGKRIGGIAITPQGELTVEPADGGTLQCAWQDFSPDSLIVLHRFLVRNPQNELERLRRHECAISFDWLAGNRDRALAAAANLAQGSETFKQRWERISKGLPKQAANP